MYSFRGSLPCAWAAQAPAINRPLSDGTGIIDLGQRSFSAFADRNPWICIDSKHGTVFVGLDPERQTFQRKGNARMEGNISSNQESIEQ